MVSPSLLYLAPPDNDKEPSAAAAPPAIDAAPPARANPPDTDKEPPDPISTVESVAFISSDSMSPHVPALKI